MRKRFKVRLVASQEVLGFYEAEAPMDLGSDGKYSFGGVEYAARDCELVEEDLTAEVQADTTKKSQRRDRIQAIKALRDKIKAGTSTAAERTDALEKLLTQYLQDLREE